MELYQTSLFGDDQSCTSRKALARNSDPATSHNAAFDMFEKLGERQQQVYWAALRAFDRELFTAQEVAQRAQQIYGGIADSYRRRVSELAELGQFAIEGTKQCEISGKQATAYRVLRLKEQS